MTHQIPMQNNRVRGELATSAYLGNRSHYFVTVEGSENPIEVASQDSGPRSDQTLKRGSEVWLSWAEGALVLLPAT